MLAFPAILSVHAIGMALAVGVNVAIALHLLGVGPDIPTREMRRFVGVFVVGFWMNALSGGLLLVAYPTKALTNPVFYVKLALIVMAIGIFAVIDRRPLRGAPGGRWLAVASLVTWAGAITAGRLLAYTYRRLLVDF